MTKMEEKLKAVKDTKGVNKKIESKKFVSSIDECKSPREIYKVLCDNMTPDILKDRVRNVSDNHLVVALMAQAARVNIQQGWRTSHQEYMVIAADNYHEMTGKEIKDFKKGLNSYMEERSTIKEKQAIIEARKEAYLNKLKEGKEAPKKQLTLADMKRMKGGNSL